MRKNYLVALGLTAILGINSCDNKEPSVNCPEKTSYSSRYNQEMETRGNSFDDDLDLRVRLLELEIKLKKYKNKNK